ncbi:hypothetical protein PVAP13_4NG258911 [Panicum virgatum]|uniref:Uncharacterized protein n=1 Tax=Panicum virgatum TaxID=38727 RepID=A0A8T0TG29_PANVG|nr:hypothetical protein PVAP13_4NG258911 [Panicum virgatum]
MSPSWTARVGPAAQEVAAEWESETVDAGTRPARRSTERDLGRSPWRSPMAMRRDGDGRKVVRAVGFGGGDDSAGELKWSAGEGKRPPSAAQEAEASKLRHMADEWGGGGGGREGAAAGECDCSASVGAGGGKGRRNRAIAGRSSRAPLVKGTRGDTAEGGAIGPPHHDLAAGSTQRIKGSPLPRRPRNGSARLFLRSRLGAGTPATAATTVTTSSMVSSLGAQRRNLPYPTSSSYSLAMRAAPAPRAPAPPPSTRKSSENLICSVPAAVRWSSNGRSKPALAPAPLPGAEAIVDSSSSSEETRQTKERMERKRSSSKEQQRGGSGRSGSTCHFPRIDAPSPDPPAPLLLRRPGEGGRQPEDGPAAEEQEEARHGLPRAEGGGPPQIRDLRRLPVHARRGSAAGEPEAGRPEPLRAELKAAELEATMGLRCSSSRGQRGEGGRGRRRPRLACPAGVCL